MLDPNLYDWEKLKSNTEGILPTEFRGSGKLLIQAVRNYVEKRKQVATQKGDIKELARLDKYYKNFNPNGMVVEHPITAKGKQFFSYINRENGYICPDAILGPERYQLRELLTYAGINTLKPKTMAELEEILNNPPGSFVIDVSAFGYDLIVLCPDDMDIGYSIAAKIEQLGFSKSEILNWTPTGYNGADDTELWYNILAAAKIYSPLLETGSFILPIIPINNLHYLVSPPSRRAS